jgi:hypothetical protein
LEAIRFLNDLPDFIRRRGSALRFIEAARVATAPTPGMGHNRAEEALEAFSVDEIISDTEDASKVLIDELRSGVTRVEPLRLASRVLRDVARRIKRMVVWLTTTGGLVGYEAINAVTHRDEVLQQTQELLEKFEAVLTPMSHLFSLLHAVF